MRYKIVALTSFQKETEKYGPGINCLMQWWWFHCIQTPKRISSTTIMLSSLTYQTIKIFRTIKSMTIIRNSFTFLSAMYNASANFANLSFICGSWRPRPSAAKRLSRGIVYPCKQQQNNFKTNISWNEKLFQECNQLTKNKNPTEKFTKLSCEQVFFSLSMIITFAFFQLEIQGGIFHSCCSLTVTWKWEK